MYKSKLYELCQKRAWYPPIYNVSHYGPDHNSRFRASVVVNGVHFNADDLSRSTKEAQNKVSQVALERLASAPSESLLPSIGAARGSYSFKNQLRSYALKNFSDLPKYTHACEGPGNALRFKAEVTVGGRTYHSTKFFSTVKEAEHDAAKAALTLLTADETNKAKDGSVSDNMTLLNDSARKEDISMPSYKTRSNGVDGFSSKVDVGNSSFVDDVAKSERQAKNNMAKDIHLPGSPKHVSSISHPAVNQNLEESPTTENYSGACLYDQGKNDSKKDNVQRVWSLQDEIILLNSILEFRLKCGKEVDSSSVELFCHFLKGNLSFTKEPKRGQISEKVKALKRKYSENEIDCFTTEHDFEMKKIASQVWPLGAKSDPRRRKCPMLEEEVQKLNIFDPCKKIKFGEEAEALEENLRKQKTLVAKLQLERKTLERETMELILKANNKSDSYALPQMSIG